MRTPWSCPRAGHLKTSDTRHRPAQLVRCQVRCNKRARTLTAASGGDTPDPGNTQDASDPGYTPAFAIGAAFVGLIVGILLSGTVGLAVLSGYDSTAEGAAIGRALAQSQAGVPLEVRFPPLSLSGLLQIPLWIGLAGAPILVSRLFGRGLVNDCLARFTAADVPTGLAIGIGAQLLAVPALYFIVFQFIGEQDVSEAARAITDRANDPFDLIVLGLMVVVGAPVVEELFFRGFVQHNLDRWIGFWPAWIIASLLFALTHFQVLQFPALLMFGMIVGAVFKYFGRLGPAIFTHMGFNAVTVVALVLL